MQLAQFIVQICEVNLYALHMYLVPDTHNHMYNIWSCLHDSVLIVVSLLSAVVAYRVKYGLRGWTIQNRDWSRLQGWRGKGQVWLF